jgi:hypothetical protein
MISDELGKINYADKSLRDWLILPSVEFKEGVIGRDKVSFEERLALQERLSVLYTSETGNKILYPSQDEHSDEALEILRILVENQDAVVEEFQNQNLAEIDPDLLRTRISQILTQFETTREELPSYSRTAETSA